KYEAGYGSLGKTVTFNFEAPLCAQAGGGASFAIGAANLKAQDFTWTVYDASTKAPAAQPIFGNGSSDWGSALLLPSGVQSKPGCQTLQVNASFITNDPSSTGGGPIKQIFFIVKWSDRAPDTGSTCGASTPASTTTTETKEPLLDHLAEDLKLAKEDEARLMNPKHPLHNHFEISADRDNMTGALIFLEGVARLAGEAEKASAQLPGSQRDKALTLLHEIARLVTRVENADKTIDSDLGALEATTNSIGDLPTNQTNTRRIEAIKSLWTAAERQKDQIAADIKALPALPG
ncbi:MAG TPA: hypothetical protein VG652_04220, partial [Gaiellaceae bacterium]|nr:hypothetical protein [Gaiellaceae bacterium]